MKGTRTAALAMAVAALLLGWRCTTARPHTYDSELRDFAQKLIGAVNEADVDGFVGLFAEDADAFFPSAENAMRRRGHAEIRAAVAPVFAYGKPPRPLVTGDLTVTSSGDLGVITFDAGSGLMHSRRTAVVRRMQGGWRIIHLHASNVREPEK